MIAAQGVRFRLCYVPSNFIHLFHGHHRAGDIEIGIGIGIRIGSWVGMNGNATREGSERGLGMGEAEGVGGMLDGGEW